MSDFDPLAGTTIGPDGKRIPVDSSGKPLESEKAIIDGDETDPEKTTAEDVGYGTVPDASNSGAELENPAAEKAEEERAASGSQADAQLGGDVEPGAGAPASADADAEQAGGDANPGQAQESADAARDANPGEAPVQEPASAPVDANPGEGGGEPS